MFYREMICAKEHIFKEQKLKTFREGNDLTGLLPRYFGLLKKQQNNIIITNIYLENQGVVEVNDYDERPGFTEPTFIRFRNENKLIEKAENPEEYYIDVIMQEKIKQYLEYAQNASF